MKKTCKILTLIIFTLFCTYGTFTQAKKVKHMKLEDGMTAENTLVLTLKDGDVIIKLLPEKAPNHVKRIKELVEKKFYDGLVFHRVIKGFMAQTGDPQGTGMGGSGQNIKAEFNDVPFERGTLGMARSQDPDSADSQFFICFKEASHLNGQYTVWGQVVDGMEHVDNIKLGSPFDNGTVTDPDKMIKLALLSDLVASGDVVIDQ